MTRNYKLLILTVFIAILVYTIINRFCNKFSNGASLNVSNDQVSLDKPLALFGIIADVQYADIDDKVIYGRKRYYRSGLNIIQQAVKDWKQLKQFYNLEFDFVLQLGDLLDIRGDKKSYDKYAIRLLNELNSLFPGNHLFNNKKIFHLIGNHETAAFIDKQYQTKLSKQIMNTAKAFNNNSANTSNYYYYDITDELRLVCLDLYEISMYDTNTSEYIKNYYKFVNLNKNSTNNKKSPWARYNYYNGAVSKSQLDWLRNILKTTHELNKKIIMAGHIPLLTNVGDINIAWNAEEILDLIRAYDGLVLAYVAGHFHMGGYYVDKFNMHHLTVSSILEAGSNYKHRYVTGFVYENKLVIKSQYVNRSFVVDF